MTDQAFQFVTASYITRVEHQRATNLTELIGCLESAEDGAIFYHTFQTLRRYHFLTERFSNDFAQWVLASLNQAELAEQLAGIDVRDYVSIEELRADLRRTVLEFCDGNPKEALRTAFEPLHFLSATSVTLPLAWDARTLAGFRAGLERLSHASFYHHFIASRLRLQLRTNDFSHWFSTALGLENLAARANAIDIYTNTLDTARAQLIALVDREVGG